MELDYAETLEARLKEIMEKEDDKSGQLDKYKSCVDALQKGILEMRSAIEMNPFDGQMEEIQHFKHAASAIHGKLFFYMRLAQIECWRQYYSREKFLELLRGVVRDAEVFLEKHATMCEYYYQAKTYLDEYLFTRRSHGEWSTEEVGTFIEADFTLGSYWVSWIMANEQLREWAVSELANLEGSAVEGFKKKVKKLIWSGKKVDLVELLYSLHLKSCFNHGKVTLKDVMEWFEFNLEISLKGYHVTVEEAALRKKDRTKFLHELAERLEMKMDEKL